MSFFSRDPTIFQLSLFLSLFVVLWIVEWRTQAGHASVKVRHSGINLLYMLSALPVQLFMIAICLSVAARVSADHLGLVYLLPGAGNVWVRSVEAFLLLDLLDYAYHYLAHNIPFLWRFHLTHHSDRAVDVSTTFREHPGETFIRVSFLIVFVALVGASVEVLALRQTFETFANISQHTQFRLSPRWQKFYGALFVTPNLHHAHHHFRLPGTNCNYGDVLSVWDRLFGTYRDLGSERIVFGVDTHMDAGEAEIFCAPLPEAFRQRAAKMWAAQETV